MQSRDRLNKFLSRINELIGTITKDRNTILERGVDRYYYIQKREELKLLHEVAEEAVRKIEEEKKRLQVLNEKIDEAYKELFKAWSKDTRWVCTVLRESESKPKVDEVAKDS